MALNAGEIAFLCENELIEIVPKQSLAPVEFAGWRSPELRALRRVTVPLWFAKTLRSQDRCTIVFPKWLELSELKQVSEHEQKEASFAALPFMWQPLSHLLFKEAGVDYQGAADEAHQILQELREVRLNKVRAGLKEINEGHLRIDNLGFMEVQEIMPLVTNTMHTLVQISQTRE